MHLLKNSKIFLPRLFIFSLLYFFLTDQNIEKLFLILIIISLFSYCLIKTNKNNKGKFLSFSSALILMPLGLPNDIKEIILPSGYQYISISLIASLIYIALNKKKVETLTTPEIISLTATAALSPATYISGPSATFEEINSKNALSLGIPNIKSINKNAFFLGSSGLLRLALGFLLNSLNSFYVDSFFLIFKSFSINSFIFIIGYGFYNFWRYYLLFSGASELCKTLLMLIKIEVIDNFNNPEISIYYHQIWGRWHLNITERIRNYLFTPLTLFALRRYKKLNNFLSFLLIEGTPVLTLFLILGLWHGGTLRDYSYGLLSTFLTLISRGISKNKVFSKIISSNSFIKEIFRLINLSIFGFTLIIYDLLNNDFSDINSKFYFIDSFPYIFSSSLIYLYYRFRIFLLNSFSVKNNSTSKRKIYFATFEIVLALIIYLFFLPDSEVGSNFIYFAD